VETVELVSGVGFQPAKYAVSGLVEIEFCESLAGWKPTPRSNLVLLQQSPVDVRPSEVTAAVVVSQAPVIQAKQMQDRGVEIVDMNFAFDCSDCASFACSTGFSRKLSEFVTSLETHSSTWRQQRRTRLLVAEVVRLQISRSLTTSATYEQLGYSVAAARRRYYEPSGTVALRPVIKRAG
jgi:hypothetical protein